MIEVLGKAAVLVAIIATGFGTKRLGWTSASDFHVLSRILLRVTLPCALATSFNAFEIAPGLLYITGLGILVVGSQLVAGYFLGRRDGHRGSAFGVLNVGSFNIGLFTIPYLGTFAGPQAVVYAALFDIGNSFVAAGIGYGWATTAATGHQITVRRLLRKTFGSIVFDTYLVLLILNLARIKLPAPVIAFTSVVANANTFLAMFTIGVGLEIVLARSKYVVAARHLATRYALAIAWFAIVWFVLPIDHGVKVAISLLLAAPLAAMMSAFTAEAGLDVEASAFITSASVVVAIVAMPLIMVGLA